MSSQSAGRRRSNMRQYSAEDQALNMISKEAESRLAAKRAARAEAREIRLKEMEKQQRESESKQDRVYELTNEHNAVKNRQLSGSRSGSRRGSTESNESESKDVDFKLELRELEEKYKAAMMTSAQLDNEKQSLVYQVELLKDQLEEQDEGYTELQRQYKDKCRDFDFQKRDLQSMEHELSILKQQLEIKDRLIEESGFVIVSNDRGEPVLTRQTSGSGSSNGPLPSGAVLVSQETKDFLEKAGGGTLGTANSDHVVHSNIVGVDNKMNTSSTNAVSDPSVTANVLKEDKIVSCVIDQVDAPSKQTGVAAGIDIEGSESVHDSSSVVSTNVTDTNGNSVSVVSQMGVAQDTIFVPDTEFPFKRSRSVRASGVDGFDEGEEFYDAVTTPSPREKMAPFEVGVVPLDKTIISEQAADEETGTSSCNRDPEKIHGVTEQLELQGVTESESNSEVINDNVAKSVTKPVLDQDLGGEGTSDSTGHRLDLSKEIPVKANAVETKNKLQTFDSNMVESEAQVEGAVRQNDIAGESVDSAEQTKELDIQNLVPLKADGMENEINWPQDVVLNAETENLTEFKSPSELELDDEAVGSVEPANEDLTKPLEIESNLKEAGVLVGLHLTDNTFERDFQEDLEQKGNVKEGHVKIIFHEDEDLDHLQRENKPQDMLISEEISIEELEEDEKSNLKKKDDAELSLEPTEPSAVSVNEKTNKQQVEEVSWKEDKDESAFMLEGEENSPLEESEVLIGLKIENIDLPSKETGEGESNIDFKKEENLAERTGEKSLPSDDQCKPEEESGDTKKDGSMASVDELGSNKEPLEVKRNVDEQDINPLSHTETTIEFSSHGDEVIQLSVAQDGVQSGIEKSSSTTVTEDSNFFAEKVSDNSENGFLQDECQRIQATANIEAERLLCLQNEKEEVSDDISFTDQNDISQLQDSGLPLSLKLDSELEKSLNVSSDFEIFEQETNSKGLNIKNASRVSESSEGEMANEYGFGDIDEGLDLDESSHVEEAAEKKIYSADESSFIEAKRGLEEVTEMLPQVTKKGKKERKAKTNKEGDEKKSTRNDTKKYSLFWSKKGTPDNLMSAKGGKDKTDKKQEGSLSGSSVSVDTLTESTAGGSISTPSKASSHSSLEPDDLEGALDKQIKEKPEKKSKKQSFFKKVFK
ncbi:leucine-rich repeat flightless-interacting protein 2 [Elysia marginata]|uniref:Leucine-rich repeat flightless-interacting protein 2 n=1 Tax=Elysia marginata TaxID=1093978 RepID=A0AAV4J4W7_9GAST|nr:leucine-rich repeat flightless-interacting protein 2 [Elysia marginata]